MHSACAKIKVERSGEVERSPERSESMFVSVAFKNTTGRWYFSLSAMLK